MMRDLKENFLQRWSRLKRELPAQPDEPASGAPGATAPAPPAALPEPDSLEFSSDFAAFMHEEVEDGLRRAALQKLFHAEHFNVMDGLDVYIDDYNSFEPIGEEMLKGLNQARGLLFDGEPPEAVPESAPAVAGLPDTHDSTSALPEALPATQDITTDKTE